MASKNTKCSPTQSEKLSFITKTKSNSFPTALCEETSNPNASLKHTLSSPSLSYTYTSVKDLIPCVESNSPLSQGGFCTIRSAEDIAISNVLVQKAAWLYLQPLPKTRTSSSSSSSFKNLLLGSHLEQAIEYLSQIHQQQHSWEDYTCP
ncbi:hypothetical protein Peur_014940 [Populus x canadensis]